MSDQKRAVSDDVKLKTIGDCDHCKMSTLVQQMETQQTPAIKFDSRRATGARWCTECGTSYCCDQPLATRQMRASDGQKPSIKCEKCGTRYELWVGKAPVGWMLHRIGGGATV